MASIVVFVRGGMVHTVWTDTKEAIEVRVVDQDTERIEDEYLRQIDGSPGHLTEMPVWVEKAKVKTVFNMETSE